MPCLLLQCLWEIQTCLECQLIATLKAQSILSALLEAAITYFCLLAPSRFPHINCCSVAQLCLTLCDPIDCSMPGFPVLHYLPEFVQTLVHRVDDAIQPSHPLSPPSPLWCGIMSFGTQTKFWVEIYFFSHETFKIMVMPTRCLDHNHQKQRSLLLLWFANWLCCL